MKIYGLTGGIASGKSTVTQFLREKGAPVIDADEIAREGNTEVLHCGILLPLTVRCLSTCRIQCASLGRRR